MLKFEIEKTCGRARLGRLHTAHGIVETPAFMPVGTAATVDAAGIRCRNGGADSVGQHVSFNVASRRRQD